jgi:plastocyanin
MAVVVSVVLGSMVLGGTSMAATPHAKPATTFQVSITEFMFTPNRIMNVHVGDTVMWTNNGTVTHTTTAKQNRWNSGNMAPGATFSFTFARAAVYMYRCNIHHQMTGSIQVVP